MVMFALLLIAAYVAVELSINNFNFQFVVIFAVHLPALPLNTRPTLHNTVVIKRLILDVYPSTQKVIDGFANVGNGYFTNKS